MLTCRLSKKPLSRISRGCSIVRIAVIRNRTWNRSPPRTTVGIRTSNVADGLVVWSRALADRAEQR